MKFPWCQAKGHLQKLDYPDLGYNGDWDAWYEQAWGHLRVAGLTNVEIPLDLTFVNLRITALCWLAHDFCASVEGNTRATVPYWNEWVTEMEIDPVVAALVLRTTGRSNHLLSDVSLTNPDLLNAEDDSVWLDEGEISQCLWPRLIMNAVFQERDGIIDALIVGFDGLMPLFESMFECTGECMFSLTSPERLRGLQWIEECCGIVITGVPEVSLPDTSTEGIDESI